MPLQQTVAKLKKLSSTGDPDFDYSFQAKLQAQGFQDFLKQEIDNGKDTVLVQMAKTLSKSTEADIDMLDATHAPAETYASKPDVYAKAKSEYRSHESETSANG